GWARPRVITISPSLLPQWAYIPPITLCTSNCCESGPLLYIKVHYPLGVHYHFAPPQTDTQRPKTAGASSRLVNCEQIEARLRGSLQKVWQKVLRACRDHDPERTGEITTNDFSGVLKQFNAETNEEELERLTVKYDSRNNGKFSYADFFRNIMLGPKPLEKSPLHRMKVQKTRVPISTGPDGPCFLNAMMRIQPKVLDCWRPMRRAFLSFDEARTGFISVQEFKQVLRKSGLNLSEDEFFHILGFFDKDLKAKVSYNDFLRAFLR
uniref:EF-hand domain-containing protein n=1 Tax=Xenopus tropicalis TaxID=8364 RepID=A0A803J2S4_XENTR